MTLASSGCWTCQLRHRKCDREAPHCNECSDRNIQCHGYGSKPAWMDDGPAEARERSRIKAAVKSNFRQTRVRQNEARKAKDRQSIHSASLSQSSPSDLSRICTPVRTSHENSRTSPPDVSSPVPDQWSALEQMEDDEESDAARPADTQSSDDLSAQEAGLVMYYLDHVFPYQFPYSSSNFRLGQRGWILWLLMRRGPFHDAAMSLAALHRRARSDDDDEYWQNHRILNHHSRALQRLCDFCQRESGTKLLENKTNLIEFLACGLFLISFEVSYS